jgi:hypothetical protein
VSARAADGIFNLAGGAAMLVASALAGWLWSRHGAPATFYAGAVFTLIAFVGLLVPPKALTGTARRA